MPKMQQLGNPYKGDLYIMTTIQVANHTITAEQIIPLLGDYQMLAKLRREILIDRAIESISCTSIEKTQAIRQFYHQNGLALNSDFDSWLKKHCLTPEQVETLAIRNLKIEKFKQLTWGEKLGTYFIRRKKQLDRVVFSLIRIQELDLAQELYFRLQAREQSFAELAKEYSQGPESLIGGFVGPIELGNLPLALAEVLFTSQIGQICPISHGEWQMIVRLEQTIPAQLDELMRQKLLNELFELWLSQQLISGSDEELKLGR